MRVRPGRRQRRPRPARTWRCAPGAGWAASTAAASTSRWTATASSNFIEVNPLAGLNPPFRPADHVPPAGHLLPGADRAHRRFRLPEAAPMKGKRRSSCTTRSRRIRRRTSWTSWSRSRRWQRAWPSWATGRVIVPFSLDVDKAVRAIAQGRPALCLQPGGVGRRRWPADPPGAGAARPSRPAATPAAARRPSSSRPTSS